MILLQMCHFAGIVCAHFLGLLALSDTPVAAVLHHWTLKVGPWRVFLGMRALAAKATTTLCAQDLTKSVKTISSDVFIVV